MNICVIGMGKIGLPLAIQFASRDGNVIGVDINPNVVELVNHGKAPFPGEPNLEILLNEAIAQKKFTATTNYKTGVQDADVIVVLVPVILDSSNQPNFESIDFATKNLSKYIKDQALISFETTLPIGTTRNHLTQIIENESGKRVGRDFYVVFSPERVSSGRIFDDLKKYPKLVGGVSPSCTSKGVRFYSQYLEFDKRNDLSKPNGVWAMASVEASEFAKLAETTYRDVNIALANRFMIHAEKLGIEINPIIEAANSQPFSHIHNPGISVGGHCIPVYPYLYLNTDKEAEIVLTARRQNEEMPKYFLDKIKRRELNLEKKKILILGIAYRPNVKESAYSGVFDLVKKIEEENAIAYVADPLYENAEIKALGLIPLPQNYEIDYVILHTAHDEFKQFNFSAYKNLKGIVDGRNFYQEAKYKKLIIQ